MRIVDNYEINDGQIFSVELEEDRFVDVKVCDGKLDGLIYVLQNEDGSTVYSDKAYLDKEVDAVYPGFEYDEKAVLDLVREAVNKGLGTVLASAETFMVRSIIHAMQSDGITLAQISEKLNYRERANVEGGHAGWDDNLIDYSTDELERIEAAWSEMEQKKSKVRVAIESTDDYSDAQFHSRLVDWGIPAPDGCYGKIVDFYRIVLINEKDRIDKLDDRVFKSFDEAKEAVLSDSALELVSYDDLVHEAGKGLGVVLADAQARSAEGSVEKAGRDIEFVKE